MRILLISSFFPPDAQGGAEISAWNFAGWLRDRGHAVAILTTARHPADAVEDKIENGLHVWRAAMPRRYPVHDHATQAPLSKLTWHMQDHCDPRNVEMVAKVLDAFRPDCISIHLLTGIGWNALPEIGRRNIPVMFALPDLAIACVRSGMFRKGHDCERQCSDCRMSSFWKQRQLAAVPRLGLYSPSAANLARLEKFVDLGARPRRILANANRYPSPAIAYEPAGVVRFLYAGRLHPTKGVDTLLDAADLIAERGAAFTIAIVGDGPIGPDLRARYAGRPWLRFHGHVSQQAVADMMAKSDILCVPSIWSENSPGVAIQALSQGLPILGSDKGGIPEILGDGRGGKIIPAGDKDAWAAGMMAIIDNPERLPLMRAGALDLSKRYEPDQLGLRLWEFMNDIAAGPATT